MSGFAGIQFEAALVERARAGAMDAHAAIYRRLSGPVYTLAVRMLKHPAKAEDVLQETFVEVLRSISQFREDASLATWVRHIAVSKCLMLLRSAWEKRGESLPDELHHDPSPERPDRVLDLAAALATLSDENRTVVWLHDVEGYTHQEIGRLMGRSVSYSKTRLARSHGHLRELLAPPDTRSFDASAVEPC